MRIIAGDFRGRRLRPPVGMSIRPTADRVREALFSILGLRVRGAEVLDLFAGTGALGLEALSRGASHAVFVDENPGAVAVIRANIDLCKAGERSTLLRLPAHRALEQLTASEKSFDLIFMDPPYGKGLIESTLPHVGEAAAPDALVVAEHHAGETTGSIAGWVRTDLRKYGDTEISIFSKTDSPI